MSLEKMISPYVPLSTSFSFIFLSFISPSIVMSFKCDFSCFNIQPNFDGDRTYSDEQFLLLGQLQIQHKL
jgi:hypothetical protein